MTKNDILTSACFIAFPVIAALSKDRFSTAAPWFLLGFLQFFCTKIIFGAAFLSRREDEAH